MKSIYSGLLIHPNPGYCLHFDRLSNRTLRSHSSRNPDFVGTFPHQGAVHTGFGQCDKWTRWMKKLAGEGRLWSFQTMSLKMLMFSFTAIQFPLSASQGIAPSIKVSVPSRSWSNRELPDNLVELPVFRIHREYIIARNVVRDSSTLDEGLWKSERVYNPFFFWFKSLTARVSPDCWKCRYVVDPMPELV
jgi:hypothetical protein